MTAPRGGDPKGERIRSEPDRLPQGGLEVLTEFITHQDTITWTALSVFLTAEIILFVAFAQALTSKPLQISVVQSAPAIGFFVTFASFVILIRSAKYLKAYYDLAKKRCHPDDLEIFDVKLEWKLAKWKLNVPTATAMLVDVHIIFFFLWGAAMAVILYYSFW